MRFPFFSRDSVNRKIFRAALAVGSATLLVKAGATVKDLIVARSFGRSDSLDAFLIALVLPTFVMSLIAGSMAAALLPVLIETRQKNGNSAVQRLLSNVLFLAGIALTASAVLLGMCAPLYLPYLAYSFPLQKLLLTREFVYLLVPWLVLSGLATFLAYVLNAIEKFAAPALVPIVTPMAVMVCVLLWKHPDSGFALVTGTVGGSLLEATFLFYLVKKHNILGTLQWHGLDDRVKAVLWQTVPMMASALLMGATPVVDQVMAAILGQGSVSALNYGNKIPMGIVSVGAMALSTAVLPYFSKMAADNDWQGCKHTLKRYSALIFSLSVPCTILLIVFSRLIVRTLFQRGAFTSADTQIVSRVQMAYCLQIPFYMAGMLFVRFITAMRQSHLLMYAAAINLVVDVVMNLVLMRIWGVAGIALSTSFVMLGSFLFVSICSIKLLKQFPKIAHGSANKNVGRLTLIGATLDRGGAERVLSDLANEWTEQGKIVTILTLDKFDLPAYALDPAVKLKRVTLPERWPAAIQWIMKKLWRIPALRYAIRESEPDLVIAFLPRINVLTLVATTWMPIPVIVSERSNPTMNKIGLVWSALRRLLYPYAAGLVVETQETLNWFDQAINVRSYLIPNFVRPHPCFGRKMASHDRDSGYVLAAMGRLVNEKGFDLLLTSFSRISSKHPEWSLMILGHGPLEAQLKAHAVKLNIQESVHFLGQVADPFPVLCRADLFVFSSRFEGYGLALAEAMACGLPVISFDCPSGPREIIRHEVDGILVPPQDIGAMASALDRLMSDSAERERLARRSPEILERFSKEKILHLWNQAFEEARNVDALSTHKEMPTIALLNNEQ